MWRSVAREERSPGDEAALVERFRRGEEAALDDIMARHRRPVYLMARRLLGNHEDADEAAQLTFVRAWRSRDRFRGDAALRTWLTRIVLNVAKSMRTGRARVESVELDESLADGADPADERLGLEQARQRVRRAVADLPPRQREVVVLKVFSEMTYREVAEVMDLSEGAVKAHLHQAVSNLRRLMGSRQEQETAS